MIVAIDGPAASGKSTTAKKVAEALGFAYLDTGAMYRAVTLAILKKNIDINDPVALKSLLDSMDLNVSTKNGDTVITLNGINVSDHIRSVEVTQHVSAVSAIPVVRKSMVKIQRDIGHRLDCVCEGRDIGTVVFSDAEYKFFIIAERETRAKRRQLDLRNMGEERSVEELVSDLKIRDQKDSTRKHSPLTRAADAVEVDTTHMTLGEQVLYIVSKVKKVK